MDISNMLLSLSHMECERLRLESVADYYGVDVEIAVSLKELGDLLNRSWTPLTSASAGTAVEPVEGGIFALGLAGIPHSGFRPNGACVIYPVEYGISEELDITISSLLSSAPTSNGPDSVLCYVSCGPVKDAEQRFDLIAALRKKIPSELDTESCILFRRTLGLSR